LKGRPALKSSTWDAEEQASPENSTWDVEEQDSPEKFYLGCWKAETVLIHLRC
jgi:hypothetical protein